MTGCDSEQGRHTQRIEITGGNISADTVHFVDDQVKGLPPLAQMLRQGFITGIEALTGIHHEQHRIGFLDGCHALICHGLVDAILIATDTAGINHNEGSAAQSRLAVLTVSGQARIIRHQRVTAARELVKQCRLAHIGAADQGDDG